MNAHILSFDPDKHQYRLGASVLPSVTQVLSLLQDWGNVDPAVLAAKAEIGTQVHDLVDQYNRGTLDEPAVDPRLWPIFCDWRDFVIDTDARCIASEVCMADPVLGYAGTADSVMRINGRVCLVDVKTGLVPKTVGPQTAAYARLWDREHPELKIRRRLCVQLTGDGYRMTECKDLADWSVFQSCLNIHHWRTR
jgi:hypothetical protein